MPKLKNKRKKNTKSSIHANKILKVNPLVVGAILLVASMITFLSIMSYDRLDLTEWSSLLDLLKGSNTHNLFGIVGANIGKAFFEYTLGYSSIIFSFYFAYVGFQLARRAKEDVFFHRNLNIALQVAFVVSIILAMPEAFETAGRIRDYFPSGLIGGLVAELLVRMFSKFGSIVIVLCYVMAMILIFFPQWLNALKKVLVYFQVDSSSKAVEVSENIVKKSTVVYDKEKEIFIDDEVIEKRAIEEQASEKLDANIEQSTDTSLEKSIGTNLEVMLGSNLEENSPEKMTFQKTFSPTETGTSESRVENSEKLEKKIPKQESTIANRVGKFTHSSDDTQKISSDYFDEIFCKDSLNDPIAVPIRDAKMEEYDSKKREFTIEKSVLEKQGNLDKVHKSLSKRERYKFPSIELLADVPIENIPINEDELWRGAKQLEEKLQDFKVEAKVVNVVAGPVITMFELRPAMGVRVSKIEALVPDIALKMSAKGIRYLGQLPGKDTIGIEIPNANPRIVFFKEIINSKKFTDSKGELPVCLGKAVNGEIIIRDLASMPHLLVAGSTGSGKSVGLNAIITSLLFTKHPDDLKFVMIDPKMLELGLYNKLSNHHLAFSSALDEKVVTSPENAMAILRAVVQEMEKRYKYLASVSVRNLKEFNTKIAGKVINPNDEKSKSYEKLPYIVVVIDELADLMITAGKEIEEPIARLTQMARAVGIHCIIATQRPSVDVITGVIKANIPTRIAFQTATKIDSRTILDLMGAEQLLGKGDMLYLPPGQAKAIRIQNAFLATEEIEDVLDHIKMQEFSKHLDLPLVQNEEDGRNMPKKSGTKNSNKKDELFEDAKVAIVMNQTASISFLQRRLGIGYSRAAKIIDQLEDDGIVGPPNKSNRREILMSIDAIEGYENIPLDN